MFLLCDLRFVLCSLDLDVLRAQRIIAFFILITHKSTRSENLIIWITVMLNFVVRGIISGHSSCSSVPVHYFLRLSLFSTDLDTGTEKERDFLTNLNTKDRYKRTSPSHIRHNLINILIKSFSARSSSDLLPKELQNKAITETNKQT